MTRRDKSDKGWDNPPRDSKRKGESRKQDSTSGPIWGAISKRLRKLGRLDKRD